MPRPTGSPHAYRPGMDGLRAVAVLGVIAYHVGSQNVPGGLLGVGMFFTLSGYLITAILMRSWQTHGSFKFKQFWLARARRLLPALFLVLATTLIATAIAQPDYLGVRLWQSLLATFYVANWGDIASGYDYFAATGETGALAHLWSLSVEEQFYVIWPLLLLLLMRLCKSDRLAAGAMTIGLAGASFALLWLLASPGLDNTRAYEGTDTRAGGLLIGAALALWWSGGIHAPSENAKRAPWWLDALGGVGLATAIALMMTMPDHTMALYHWGILALSIGTLAVVAAAAHPASWTGRILGIAPLRWIGERSYGVYLWHLPVIAFFPSELLTEEPRLRIVLILSLTLGLAELSWTFIENPIRINGFVSTFASWRKPAYLAVAGMVVVGTTALAAPPITFTQPTPEPANIARHEKPGPLWGLPVLVDLAVFDDALAVDNSLAGLTSCTSVLHIGDSTSLGMIDETRHPEAEDRLDSQYRRVGVTDVRLDILGARSVVERYQGEPNAQDAVLAADADGFDGCLVIAMGLNEAANVAVGGRVSIAERIDLMQALAGDRPTLWLTVETKRTSGPWAQAEMDKMNAALLDACRRYPHMRVYDWAGEAPDEWFARDRIHFTPEGDRERALRTADALVNAFPAGERARYQCIVHS